MTQDKKTEAREFDLFLKGEENKGSILAEIKNDSVKTPFPIGVTKIHVIEYSAYQKLREENDKFKNYVVPGFEVMMTELKAENEALRAALELINKEELNAQRPGGGYSRSAKISYDVLAKYPRGEK